MGEHQAQIVYVFQTKIKIHLKRLCVIPTSLGHEPFAKRGRPLWIFGGTIKQLRKYTVTLMCALPSVLRKA
jgi:hypothetical protein